MVIQMNKSFVIIKNAFYLIVFCVSIASAHAANQIKKIDNPPVYCVKRDGACIVYLFGSIHYAEADSPAVTKQLMTIAGSLKNFYFEVAPYGAERMNAKTLGTEAEYLAERKNFFQQFEVAKDVLLTKFSEALLSFSKTGNFFTHQSVYQQVVHEHCKLSRYAGTEESLYRFLAGKDVTLHSIESVSRAESLAPASSLPSSQTATTTIDSSAFDKANSFFTSIG